MNNNLKNLFIILSLILFFLVFYYNSAQMSQQTDEISYSDFLNMVEPVEGKKVVGKIVSKEGKDTKFDRLVIEKDTIEGWYIPTDSKDAKPKAPYPPWR